VFNIAGKSPTHGKSTVATRYPPWCAFIGNPAADDAVPRSRNIDIKKTVPRPAIFVECDTPRADRRLVSPYPPKLAAPAGLHHFT